MTSLIRTFGTLALACLIQAPALTQPRLPQALETGLKELDSQFTAEFAKDGVGGASIGVVSGSTLIWSRHYGYADMEAKRAPTSDTAYRIGSITKQFTALALLQLIEQGKVRLSDPLEKYVPEIRKVQKMPAGTPPITLQQVATMHSGLETEPGCDASSVGPVSEWQKRVVDCLPSTSFANEPGTTYLYSNIGYAILGLAVERAGKQSLIDQVTARILTPLGMTRTAFEPTPVIRADLARGYQRLEGKADPTVPDRELEGRGYRVPNGGLFSTLNDLVKFVAWEMGEGPSGILDKGVQNANYQRSFFHDPMTREAYGVGFMIVRRGEFIMLGHGGATPGYRAVALVNRPSKLAFIVLRNAEGGTLEAPRIGIRMMDRIMPTTKAP